MKVLIGCEFSGRVRDAFRRRGIEAWSNDIDITNDGSEFGEYHYQEDIFESIKRKKWDLLIAFPPCTYITIAGNRYYVGDPRRAEAIEFVKKIASVDIPHIAIENPVGALSTQWRKPDQIIHPWWFGHDEKKRTCLWLKNLPLLRKTNVVVPQEESQIVRYSGHYSNRGKVRSLTYFGIADAMAEQWQAERIQKLPDLAAGNSSKQEQRSSVSLQSHNLNE